MQLKLTLQVIEPFESRPSEISCSPELIPSDQVIGKAFFEAFLMDKFSRKVSEFFIEEFRDILYDVIDSVSFPPRARYYYYEVREELVKRVLPEVRKLEHMYHAIYIFTDEEKNEELFRSELNLVSLMEDWFNNWELESQSTIDAAGAIKHGIEQFIASGSWHYDWIYEGEQKKPIMWFGLNGEKPEEGWILNLEDNPDTGFTWKDFWFPDDGWTNRVPDADDYFIIWMEDECGDWLPSMMDVISTCPIEIDEQDDYRTLSEKIATLLP